MRSWGLYRLRFDSCVLADFTPKDDGIQTPVFSDKPLTFSSLGPTWFKIEFLPYNKRQRSVARKRSESFEGIRRRQRVQFKRVCNTGCFQFLASAKIVLNMPTLLQDNSPTTLNLTLQFQSKIKKIQKQTLKPGTFFNYLAIPFHHLFAHHLQNRDRVCSEKKTVLQNTIYFWVVSLAQEVCMCFQEW